MRPPGSKVQIDKGIYLFGLAAVSSVGCCFNTGNLTPWTRQCTLQRAYEKYPEDCYSVRIEKFYVFEKHYQIKWKDGHRHRRDAGVNPISLNKPFFQLCEDDRETLHDVRVQDLDNTSAWDLLAMHDLHIATWNVLLIPYPIARLVSAGVWKRLLLNVSWHDNPDQQGPLPSWPPAEAAVWDSIGRFEHRHGETETTPGETYADILTTQMTPENIQEIYQHLVEKWTGLLLEHDPTLREDIEGVATTLREWYESLDEPNQRKSYGGRFKHATWTISECLRLSQQLKAGSNSMQDVVMRCLRLELPSALRGNFLDDIHSPFAQHHPSPALLRRYEIAVDVALLLWKRDHSVAHPDVARYGMMDSSPIGGIDWLWQAYIEIDREKLWETFEAVVGLQNETAEFAQRMAERYACRRQTPDWTDWRSDEPTPPMWKEWHATVLDNIREHIDPPAALGSGHRGLAHKCSCVAYTWALQEHDPSDLEHIGRSFETHTPDLGVEAGVPRFWMQGKTGASSLLPDWLLERFEKLPNLDTDGHGPPTDDAAEIMEDQEPVLRFPDIDETCIDGPCLSDSASSECLDGSKLGAFLISDSDIEAAECVGVNKNKKRQHNNTTTTTTTTTTNETTTKNKKHNTQTKWWLRCRLGYWIGA